MTTKDLDYAYDYEYDYDSLGDFSSAVKPVHVSLAIGERHCSDRECLEYEREYLPLHLFAHSYVGCQTLIPGDSVCGACVWDHSLGNTSREVDNQRFTQEPA